jgi:integrase
MQGDEIRALGRLQREQEASPYVFTDERGGPMSAKSFGTLFERLGRRAGMPSTMFPHMLRHACGYALANAGHDTRGRRRMLLRYNSLGHDALGARPPLAKQRVRFHPQMSGQVDSPAFQSGAYDLSRRKYQRLGRRAGMPFTIFPHMLRHACG